MLYITEVLVDDVRKGKSVFEAADYDPAVKEKVLQFLKKYPPSAFTSAPAYDCLTGEEVADADNEHSDGVYLWYVSEMYAFEKYNLPLKADFIDYVMEKSM